MASSVFCHWEGGAGRWDMDVFIGAIAGRPRSGGARVMDIGGRFRLDESIASSEVGECADNAGGAETGGGAGDETRGVSRVARAKEWC